ncbi:MAG: glycosyl hydrolase family 28-related protein [Kiritimatiellae bacterium]|nr:glycosyl hydrolase family 28-related protein [Kiritimatiellia bacterium]
MYIRILFFSLLVSISLAVELVKTVFDTPDLVIAEQVFQLETAKESDCSSQLQATIDRISDNGGGTLFLPAGFYRIESPVTVKEGVILRGDLSTKLNQSSRGTVFKILAHRGEEDAAAAFTVQRGAGLRGLTFWYPEQTAVDPAQYPWTVRTANMAANDNQSVFDCVFVNSWKAICVGPEGNELHTFRRLKICALKTGIAIDSTTDIGRISEVLISPQVWIESGLLGAPAAEGADKFREWLLDSESVALIMGRSDWEYIWRLKVDGYNQGVVFIKGKRGTTNAVMAEGEITSCRTALRVEHLNAVGLSVYSSRLHGYNYAVAGEKTFDSVVQFHSCDFQAPIHNTGSGLFSLRSCSAQEVNAESGDLLLGATSFKKTILGAGVRCARVLGFDRKSSIVDNRSVNGDVEVASVWPAAIETSLVAPEPAPFRRPKSDGLLNVVDFGASSALADNSVAFQKALDAAGANKGGGTVYVPAGYYKFTGDIKVPSRVELRGCLDVPHHTISDGSVLMPSHNAGKENGPAFVQLSSDSGLRGLSFWYPEQPLNEPAAYPWCVQSQGKGCWIFDTNIGNAWQGVDFATFPNDGHVIQYLSGAMFKRGLFVGNCKKRGWVEDVQFNPHYMGRRSKKLPFKLGAGKQDAVLGLIEYQRQHLQGIIFRDCMDEQVRGTFLYAAHEGISFYGKNNAAVLMHGSDTVSRAAYLAASEGSKVSFALAQLVSLGAFTEGAIVTAREDRGVAVFQNSQIWAGNSTALFEGRGRTVMQQFVTRSGPVTVNAGRVDLEQGIFDLQQKEQLFINGDAAVSVASTVNQPGALNMGGNALAGSAFANSATPRQEIPNFGKDIRSVYQSSFERSDPPVPLQQIANPGGGLRKVSGSQIQSVKRDDARSGDQALLFKGLSEDPAYSFAYHVVSSEPVAVLPDTKLVYWKKPLNENGRSTAFDLYFQSKRALRSLPHGSSHHAGTKSGAVGQWVRIEVPLGSLSGDVIETIMVAYDTRSGGGPFEVLFDNVFIGAEISASAWQLQVVPAGGEVDRLQAVSIQHGADVVVHYTLDGSNPAADSKCYDAPFILPRKGPVELRYAPVGVDGTVSRMVFAVMYEVR